MLSSTTFDISGHEIIDHKGMVRGIIVRSPTISQGILGSLKNIIGGQIGAYTTMCEQTRGQAFEAMERHAAELGVDDLVELSEASYAEMPGVFAQARALVLASLPLPVWEEQFGMVIAEAFAAGVPVVASDSGAIPEVVRDAGAIFPAGDWRALARLLAGELPVPSPELAREYSIEAAADRLDRAYRRVLG